MADLGRNDPCRCGSGRKYKKCCLPADEAAWRADAAQDRARTSIFEQLGAFLDAPEFDADEEWAVDLFWADWPYGVDPALVRLVAEHETCTLNFNCWLLFDFDLDAGRTAADLFEHEHGRKLDPGETDYLSRMRAAHQAPYEVEGVLPGEGVTLVNLWNGERVFVTERTATQRLEPGSVLAARVVPDTKGVARFEGGLYTYPASIKLRMLEALRILHSRFRARYPDGTDATFFKHHGAVFQHLWLETVPVAPELMVDTGIDRVRRVSFQVLDEPAVRAVLTDGAGIEQNEDGSFLWNEPPGRLGRWYFERDRLRFETTSMLVDESARSWIEAVVPAAVKYRVTSLRVEVHHRSESES